MRSHDFRKDQMEKVAMPAWLEDMFRLLGLKQDKEDNRDNEEVKSKAKRSAKRKTDEDEEAEISLKGLADELKT